MYTLKALRDKLGLKVRVYEAGETVGGTWYWNPDCPWSSQFAAVRAGNQGIEVKIFRPRLLV